MCQQHMVMYNSAGTNCQHIFLVLQEVLSLMDASLADIEDRWTSGRLEQVGVTAQETAHLVKALFEYTDGRQSLLGMLKDSRQK